MGLCFAMFVFLMFRRPLASHDSNPYPNRSRIARYNATKVRDRWRGGKHGRDIVGTPASPSVLPLLLLLLLLLWLQ